MAYSYSEKNCAGFEKENCSVEIESSKVTETTKELGALFVFAALAAGIIVLKASAYIHFIK